MCWRCENGREGAKELSLKVRVNEPAKCLTSNVKNLVEHCGYKFKTTPEHMC